MKRKFLLGIIGTLTASALLFSGCSKVSSSLEGANIQKSSAVSDTSSSYKIPKNITDKELMKEADGDSSVQLDSVDNQSQQLTTDEINSLLNDNNDLNNVPSTINVK